MANHKRRSLSWMVLCAGVLSFGSYSALADKPATAIDLNTLFDDEPAFVQLKSSEYADELEPIVDPQVADAGDASLSLSRLEELALAYNPTMQQAAASLEKSKGIHTQVGLKPNPVLGYAGGEIGNEGQQGQQGAFLAQKFITAGKLGLNRAVASQDVERSHWKYEIQRYRVVNDVRQGYYRMLGAHETVKLLEQLVTLAESNLNAASELFKAGQAARPQVLQATVEVQNNRVALQNARNQEEAMWRQLTAAVGVPTLPRTRVVGDLTLPAPEIEWAGTWEWLQTNSPEVQLAARGISRARFAIKRAYVEPIPNVTARVSVQRDTSTGYTIAGVQIGIPIPINNRNQGTIRAAHAELIRASREVERVQLSLRQRLASSFRNYLNARQQVDAYRDEILPTAKETLDLVTEGYKNGELDYLLLLTTQRTYFQTGLAYVSAQTNLWLNVVLIEGLVLSGGLDQPGSVNATANQSGPMTPFSPFSSGTFPSLQP